MVAAGGGSRNHGHTNAAADDLTNRIEVGQADAQFQATARAGRMVLHLILEGVARRETDMVMGKGITASTTNGSKAEAQSRPRSPTDQPVATDVREEKETAKPVSVTAPQSRRRRA